MAGTGPAMTFLAVVGVARRTGFRVRRFARRPGMTSQPYTSFTFFSGRLRTGLPVAA
jgi:hypothetical protein